MSEDSIHLSELVPLTPPTGVIDRAPISRNNIARKYAEDIV